jgi:hypothetical protein
LIAQEMQQVFPNLVKEKNGYLAISYNLELQMVAINAIQEVNLNMESMAEPIPTIGSFGEKFILIYSTCGWLVTAMG